MTSRKTTEARGERREAGIRQRPRPCLATSAGFTLVEVLVVLAIMAVLFSMLFVPMTSSLTMVSSGRVQADMQQRLRLAMDQVQRDLNEAIYVYPPEVVKNPITNSYLVDYSAVTFIPPARDASGQVLKPMHPALDANGTPIAIRYAVHTPNTTIRLWPAVSGGYPANDKYFQVSGDPGPENTFTLYREEGQCKYDDDLGTYVFGSPYPTTGGPVPQDTFVIDRPTAENAVTSRVGTDIPVTQTICRDNGKTASGWVQVNLGGPNDTDPTNDTLDNKPNGDNTWTPQLVYLFAGVQFRPARVEDEQLKPTPDGGVYWASKPAWLGYQNDGSKTVGDLVWPLPQPGTTGQWINSSEIRPRIVVRRWDSTATPPGYTTVVMDTDALDPATTVSSILPGTDNLLGLAPGLSDTNGALGPQYAPVAPWDYIHGALGSQGYTLGLRWNSKAGCVLPGAYVTEVLNFDVSADPGNSFWPVTQKQVGTMRSTRPSYLPLEPAGPPWLVPENLQSGSPVAMPVKAEPAPYGSIARAPGDPRAPLSYVLDPYQLESPQYQAGTPAANVRDVKVVVDNVKVWVIATYAATGQTVRTDYSPTTIADPEQLGATQFYVESFDMGRQARIIFNRYNPPSPDAFVPPWASGNTYAVGQVVRGPADGLVYQCKTAQGPPPIPPNNPLSSADDEPGVGRNWSSIWKLATASPLSRFEVHVQYLARRDFDPVTGTDDQVLASYSTGADYNVSLGMAEFSPYESADNNGILTPFKAGPQVTISAHMSVGNVGR